MNFVQGRLRPVFYAFLCAGVFGSGLGRHALAQDSSDALVGELAAEGQVIFGTSCVSCHDADGGDGSAPALNNHPSLGAAEHVVRQILRGNAEKGMPPFAATLNDRQVAAVATYIRNSWDNAHGAVLEADVKKVREATAPAR
jgi:mono/diheme cytochrome c family protein